VRKAELLALKAVAKRFLDDLWAEDLILSESYSHAFEIIELATTERAIHSALHGAVSEKIGVDFMNRCQARLLITKH
jgi:hypothetical protein